MGLIVLAACTFTAVGVNRARAEAALAVGLPGDVAKQGLAMGWALNYPSKEKAQAEALKRCRNFQDAPQSTKDLCKIIESFRQRCLAVALDPENGTTGVGWAVAKDQKQAEGLAMDRCVDTSEKRRRDFCRVTLTRCDGKK
jgi:hypothetical protein